MTNTIAHELLDRGLHVFPTDHPDQPRCIGRHGPDYPCDGERGKHPAVKWGVWAVAVTEKMIDLEWRKHRGLCNTAISCGPSGLVVLDEDELGDMDRWCDAYGITLPDTYIVTTGRGRHFYFRWDHTVQRIGNREKAMEGFHINVRGDGGYAIAEGSQHASGAIYEGNGKPIADLPQQVADLLLAGATHTDQSEPFWENATRNFNTAKIPFKKRHHNLIAYAGRLRKSGLDYHEAEPTFRARWLLCEQPKGQIPDAHFHSATCPYPVTWEEAQAKLRDVYGRYAAGHKLDEGNSPIEGMPQLWPAADLKAAEQPAWLAKGRIPRAAPSLLVGDEGIGKSLFWVWLAAAFSTGKPLPEFGIPQREPGHIVIICTEDDWTTTVRPRLEVAGADLTRVSMICTENDGSGAPVFPRDLFLIREADPPPVAVFVDAWLDTVPASLQVRDPHQARLALHPWKEVATATGAAVLLLTHTNRVATANARDRYGITGELRKKARMTLFAQTDDDGNLVIGPEKMNTAAPIPASKFTITAVQHFEPTEDHDGTVPLLRYVGDSTQTAREHLADNFAADHDTAGADDTVAWLAALLAPGPRWSTDVHQAREAAGISDNKLKSAKRRLHVESQRADSDGPWFMRLPQHVGRVPEVQMSPVSGHLDFWTSGGLLENPQIASTSQDVQRTNGETRGHVDGHVDAPQRQTTGRNAPGFDSYPPCFHCDKPVTSKTKDERGRYTHLGCQQKAAS